MNPVRSKYLFVPRGASGNFLSSLLFEIPTSNNTKTGHINEYWFPKSEIDGPTFVHIEPDILSGIHSFIQNNKSSKIYFMYVPEEYRMFVRVMVLIKHKLSNFRRFYLERVQKLIFQTDNMNHLLHSNEFITQLKNTSKEIKSLNSEFVYKYSPFVWWLTNRCKNYNNSMFLDCFNEFFDDFVVSFDSLQNFDWYSQFNDYDNTIMINYGDLIEGRKTNTIFDNHTKEILEYQQRNYKVIYDMDKQLNTNLSKFIPDKYNHGNN